MKKNGVLIGLLLAWNSDLLASTEHLDSLMSMSLEELSMLDVTMETASKTERELSEIPASVYVLSGERILRSGASNITEALALIPGMYVSKWDENSYHVSTRGFHDGLYNKMLVMVDGRSVYSPIYGGVYWTTLDYILADIERIEVLRGPSGAIWGGNAANGVINIITKSAQETQGTYLSGTVGQYDAYEFAIRQGLKLSETTYGRAFYKNKSNPSRLNAEAESWRTDTAGVVIESLEGSSTWSFKFGGTTVGYDQDVATITFDENDPYWQPVDIEYSDKEVESSSAYAQLNLEKEYQNGNVLSGSLWIDRVKDTADDAPGEFKTIDLEANYTHRLNEQHNVLLGLGYRYIDLEFFGSYDIDNLYSVNSYGRGYNTSGERDSIVNVFAQSEYHWSSAVSTIVGAKGEYFEQNDSFEISPQARVLWKLNDQNTLWAGVGRSVIAPSYMDSNSIYYSTFVEYLDLDGQAGLEPYGGVFATLPNAHLKNESVITYELGYRYAGLESFEFDSNLYFSEHQNIRGRDCSSEPYVSDQPEHIFVCYTSDAYEADSYGLELGARYMMTNDFSLYATYSYTSVDVSWSPSDISNGQTEAYLDIPRHQLATFQTLWNINDAWQWDFVIKYSDIKYSDDYYRATENRQEPTIHDVTPFVTVDTRLGWQKHSNAPLVELIVQKIGESELYDSWGLYPNEELVYVRLSHEF